MKRYRQTFEEISASLIPIEASWLDSHAEEVIRVLKNLLVKATYTDADVAASLLAISKLQRQQFGSFWIFQRRIHPSDA